MSIKNLEGLKQALNSGVERSGDTGLRAFFESGVSALNIGRLKIWERGGQDGVMVLGIKAEAPFRTMTYKNYDLAFRSIMAQYVIPELSMRNGITEKEVREKITKGVKK